MADKQHQTREERDLERAEQRYKEAHETLRKARAAARRRKAADERRAREEARAAWIRGTTELCDWLAASYVVVDGKTVNAYDYVVQAVLPVARHSDDAAGSGAEPPVPPARPEERA